MASLLGFLSICFVKYVPGSEHALPEFETAQEPQKLFAPWNTLAENLTNTAEETISIVQSAPHAARAD
jgi:hypothetical protein